MEEIAVMEGTVAMQMDGRVLIGVAKFDTTREPNTT